MPPIVSHQVGDTHVWFSVFFFRIVEYGLIFHMKVQKSESKLDPTFDK